MSACEVCAGEHNFELEFRKVYAARELICRVVGAERPGAGLANDVKTDSLNHAIDSDEVKKASQDCGDSLRYNSRTQRDSASSAEDSRFEEQASARKSSTVSSQLQFHGRFAQRKAIVRRSCGSTLPVCRTTCRTQSIHPVPFSIKNEAVSRCGSEGIGQFNDEI